ncbi:MAG: hypothetical protein H0X43_03580 [Nitrosospira sp.]|nr:hypothetical protein [Nitrosospira sp.]
MMLKFSVFFGSLFHHPDSSADQPSLMLVHRRVRAMNYITKIEDIPPAKLPQERQPVRDALSP